jgi:hypothetical protein
MKLKKYQIGYLAKSNVFGTRIAFIETLLHSDDKLLKKDLIALGAKQIPNIINVIGVVLVDDNPFPNKDGIENELPIIKESDDI